MEEQRAKVPHKISNVTAGFMLATAVLFDLLQFLLNLTVLLALLSYLIDFLAICIFGVWFAILGVNYFSGRKSGLKLASVFGATVLEFVPFINAIPAITAGVLGIIVSTRLEERSQNRKALNKIPNSRIP